ncbi:restriction endonuclease subunit S [Morganella morganii]|uniref:Restriction endonuclease subunit S n=1 Tax=Morganella morganii TaxID=582 RepID=A0A9Q4CPW4_MORMO|nr:restriction endonuclease subunit S [Morganella morganii]MCY0791255.1 restriction endonuclease subunit S [Morganella morganii]
MKAEHWPRVKVSVLCELIVDCINKTAPRVERVTPYKMIRTPNIKNGKIDLAGCRYVEKETYEKWTRRATVNKGDVLLTREAPMGEAGLVNFEDTVFLGQRIMQYRVNPKKLDPNYLLYAFLSPDLQFQFRKHDSTGSTVSHIRVPDCSEFEINTPPLSVQKQISKVLRDIDDKIDLNNRINAELEAMAKTLYDYWFVQFDFPDANGKPYKASGGKMVYNPVLKQKIPADWHVNAISDWIRSDKTGDWGKETKQGNYTLQVDCIRGADINGINGQGNVDAPNRFILKKNDHKLLAPFDFVIEISGGSPTQSTGRMAFITEHVLDRFNYPLICSNFCKAIDLIDKSYFYNFAYQWQSLYENGVLFGWEGKTSGIKNLLFDSFVSNYNVVMPPKDLAEKFFQFVSPLQEQRQKKLKENAELAGLRDWLLPMLMNGQVTVKPITEAQEAQHG